MRGLLLALVTTALAGCVAGGAPPLVASGASLLLPAAQRVDPADVHTVHLVMSHHLDVGLDLPMKLTLDCVGYATKIVQRYFDIFIP